MDNRAACTRCLPTRIFVRTSNDFPVNKALGRKEEFWDSKILNCDQGCHPLRYDLKLISLVWILFDSDQSLSHTSVSSLPYEISSQLPLQVVADLEVGLRHRSQISQGDTLFYPFRQACRFSVRDFVTQTKPQIECHEELIPDCHEV